MSDTDPSVYFALAHEAWQNGQAALAAGNLGDASRWLERAQRVAPADDAVMLSLAVLRLRQGCPSDAERLLESLTARVDLREAWLALAAARLEQGDAQAAASALRVALSGQVLP